MDQKCAEEIVEYIFSTWTDNKNIDKEIFLLFFGSQDENNENLINKSFMHMLKKIL